MPFVVSSRNWMCATILNWRCPKSQSLMKWAVDQSSTMWTSHCKLSCALLPEPRPLRLQVSFNYMWLKIFFTLLLLSFSYRGYYREGGGFHGLVLRSVSAAAYLCALVNSKTRSRIWQVQLIHNVLKYSLKHSIQLETKFWQKEIIE